MSNLLPVAMIDTIRSLRQRGWSQRRIARELGIDRQTVARYLRPEQPPKPATAPIGPADGAGEANPAIAPTGSARGDEESNPAIAPTGSTAAATGVMAPAAADGGAGRPSECQPWRALILA